MCHRPKAVCAFKSKTFWLLMSLAPVLSREVCSVIIRALCPAQVSLFTNSRFPDTTQHGWETTQLSHSACRRKADSQVASSQDGRWMTEVAVDTMGRTHDRKRQGNSTGRGNREERQRHAADSLLATQAWQFTHQLRLIKVAQHRIVVASLNSQDSDLDSPVPAVTLSWYLELHTKLNLPCSS